MAKGKLELERSGNEKESRHRLILDLLASQVVGSQEELGEQLAAKGVEVTQATLSRDLRELKVVKTAGPDGSPRYASIDTRLGSPVQSIEGSNNLLVVKTDSGLAAATAYKVDDLGMPEILGTVAGEDTLLVVLSEKVNWKRVKAELLKRL